MLIPIRSSRTSLEHMSHYVATIVGFIGIVPNREDHESSSMKYLSAIPHEGSFAVQYDHLSSFDLDVSTASEWKSQGSYSAMSPSSWLRLHFWTTVYIIASGGRLLLLLGLCSQVLANERLSFARRSW